jgi:membrane protease YdiL (CAAX protease family)
MTRKILGPVLVFVAVSAVASPLLAQLQAFTGLNPDILRLTVFSTAVGAAAVWLIWRGGLPYPPTTAQGLVRPLLASVGVAVVVAGLLFALAKAEGAPWRPADLGHLGAPLGVVLLVQFLGAAAEEVGWRGLVQPLLETRMKAPLAALITGALFALGHFYIAFAVSPLSCVLFVVSAIALSLILGLLTIGRSAGDRILIATVAHFLVNMATFLLFADGDGSPRYFADQALVFGACALPALVMLRRRPGPHAL